MLKSHKIQLHTCATSARLSHSSNRPLASHHLTTVMSPHIRSKRHTTTPRPSRPVPILSLAPFVPFGSSRLPQPAWLRNDSQGSRRWPRWSRARRSRDERRITITAQTVPSPLRLLQKPLSSSGCDHPRSSQIAVWTFDFAKSSAVSPSSFFKSVRAFASMSIRAHAS